VVLAALLHWELLHWDLILLHHHSWCRIRIVPVLATTDTTSDAADDGEDEADQYNTANPCC
jgi:hypothetical protein